MRDGPVMMFAEPLTSWWPWFAWYPVKTWDHRWRWLCWVERRLMHKKIHLPGALSEWFQHRITPCRTRSQASDIKEA